MRPLIGGHMKKGLWLAVIVLLGASPVYAGVDRVQKVDLGFNLSGAGTESNNLGESIYFSGGLSYGLNEIVAVGVSGAWTEVGFKANPPAGVVDGMDLRMTPIFGDIILRVPTGTQPHTPYLIFGLGALLSTATARILCSTATRTRARTTLLPANLAADWIGTSTANGFTILKWLMCSPARGLKFTARAPAIRLRAMTWISGISGAGLNSFLIDP